jgi:hypothetical protein
MQAAADLAALNAAYCQAYPSKSLCTSAANFSGAGGSAMQGMALAMARANGFDVGKVTLVTPYSGDANRIAVTVAQPVTASLLGIAGFRTFNPSGRAVGAVQSTTISVSLLALNPTKCGALALTGNGSISSNSGGIQANSNCSNALTETGNSSINVDTATISVVGGYSTSGNATFSSTPITGVAPMPDPLASLSPPTGSGLSNQGAFSCSGTQTIYPGIYTSISASSNCNLTMQPGTYIIKGGGISLGGNASLTGTGVFIYNAGSNFPSTGGSFGGISLSGNGTFNLSPQTSGSYAGLLIFQSRDNPQTLTISGNGAVAGVQGTIYGQSAPVSVTGNGTLPAQFVVDSVTVTGNGSMNIQYTSNQVYSATTTSITE